MTAPRDPTPETRVRMRAQRSARTGPEDRLRAALRRAGVDHRTYRVDARLPLEGVRRRADVLFPRARVAVFVDGCWWHGCPDHYRTPRSNPGWWDEKIARNRARDLDTDRRLRDAGWRVVRGWEHEHPEHLAFRAVVALAGFDPGPWPPEPVEVSWTRG